MNKKVIYLALSAMLLALCFPALAQQAGKVYRIGYLFSGLLPPKPFLQALRDLGYVEGKNIVVEFRAAEGREERLPGLAAELVRLKVDIIVAPGGPAARAAKNATTAIPVVIMEGGDPTAGLVASLARPGGNVTGIVTLSNEFKGRAGALIELPNPLFHANRKRIVEFANQKRLPAIFHSRDFVDAGGLMCYGESTAESLLRVASYVDRILKGSKPADLPVEQPTKFELVINLKTAKALGLTIPQSVLFRADQVIQ